MLNDLLIQASIAVPVILLIAMLTGIVYWTRSERRERFFTLFLAATLALEIVSRNTMYSVAGNLHLLLISSLLEFAFFAVLYLQFLHRKPRKYLLFSSIVLTLYLIYQSLQLSPQLDLSSFQLYDRMVADSMVVVFCLVFLYDSLSTETPSPALRRYTNTFVLIYAVIDFFMSLTSNFMVNETPNLVLVLWFVRLLAQIALYIHIGYVIWHNGRMQIR